MLKQYRNICLNLQTDYLLGPRLLDSNLSDQARHIFCGHIIHLSLVFFFQTFFQIFGGNEAGFAVGQIT
jgi:hypothetical protein